MVITLYITSCILFFCLVASSVFFYKKSRDLAPLFLRKQSLEQDIENLKKDIEVAQNTKAELYQEVAKLLSEKYEADRVIAKAKSERKFLETYDADLADKHNTIEKTKLNIKNIRDELAKITAAYSEKASELQKLEAEVQSRDLHIQASETKLSELEATLKAKQKSFADIVQDIKNVENQLSQLKKEYNDIDAKYKATKEELERIKGEQKQLAESCEKLRSKEDEYSKSIRALKNEESSLAVTVGEHKAVLGAENSYKWSDLDSYSQPTICTKNNTTEEVEFLEKFTNTLKSNNIVFDEGDRIIKAFHTGLKVQDASPLVVLAGISGTGKSLLPNLYSHAIGMNFLQIAVQPRWDSPQDLFGFYNYMERRFKATELSRLLWACDIYNNKNLSKNKEKDLRMNLVLLDEMNLAKVEYYFSDMLSKLEARRGITPKNLSERYPAEIELECSSTNEKLDSRRIFVNNNTLFVGTMNEDESTQSLSDKVMDRANVMRFGRPSSLNVKPSIEKFRNQYSDSEISYGTWNSWYKKMTKKQENKLKDIIMPMNDKLADIGRPFAHRVWQAMSTYVANYPGGDNAINNAIADQIEMKILPKLSGLEKDDRKVKDTLDYIERLIEQVEDQKLLNAFKEAKDNNNVFFQWRGVMR